MSGQTEVAAFTKAATVQRNLANGRLLVQRVDVEKAVQLSGSAPLIWELLDQHNTIPAVVEQLAEQFSDPAETIEAGVRQAIDSFISQQLVEEV